MTNVILLALAGLIVAPLVGGLIGGIDRKLTARVQGRVGPPIVQSFYDVAKLWAKETTVANPWLTFCSWVYVGAAATSVVLFFMMGDLLLIFFVQAIGAVFLVIGALSVPSPYSQVGGQRELLQILAYEPLLILVIAGIYVTTGSFKVEAVLAHDTPLLLELPLLFIVLGYALTIKLRKSPFDISGSHHAHQELVKGVYTEYVGRNLALVEIAHWYETILILGFVALFWTTSLIGLAVLIVVTYALEIIIDNISARLTWRWMLGSVWVTGLCLSTVNLAWLYFA
ncbi:MAG: NADH-quinone oxidoreductase subunit H [Rhodospirillales bacterium]|nr:NADH-quinone oxidoreductase subunit H [Alphaproteobacteria bacterium]MBL6929784.1 NADH-quinone oxidoreductase subunit H [Rhodospirillales bacterium]